MCARFHSSKARAANVRMERAPPTPIARRQSTLQALARMEQAPPKPTARPQLTVILAGARAAKLWEMVTVSAVRRNAEKMS